MPLAPYSPASRPSGAAPAERLPDHVPIRSFIVRLRTVPERQGPSGPMTRSSPHTLSSADGRWEVGFAPESPELSRDTLQGRGPISFVLGDDAEWGDGSVGRCMGNAVAVRCDLVAGHCEISSSITGLPAVFLSRRPDGVLLTSDLSLLEAAAGPLEIDPAAAADVFHLGYPAGHRSLFTDTSLVAGGCVVRVAGDGRVTTTRAWSLPDSAPRLDWRAYLDFQAQAFRAAMGRMDLSRTFFSLTGGLDTRTILAVLVSEGISLPTATLCGPALSLDARVAGALSQAYGFPHHVVHLDAAFLRNLPTYITEASRRSGGISGFEESGEVYFYRQLAGLGARRLAGGFGNQVARQGLERVSRRDADLSVLAERFAVGGTPAAPRTAVAAREGGPWRSAYERSLQEDGALPSVGNACIGQVFATQQTPYASRVMIESLGCAPLGRESAESFYRSGARLRDLRHRVLGEPADRSFQRALIARVGGPVAAYPINWGWRPRGGVSPRGLVLGALACLDQVAAWPKRGSRPLRAVLRLLGTEGLHEIKPYRVWLTEWLRDFVHDTLLSTAAQQSGLFNTAELSRVLRDHYVLGKPRTGTITAALDLALAHQLFCTEPARRSRQPIQPVPTPSST